MLGVARVNENFAYHATGSNGGGGQILRTDDGANTWQAQNCSGSVGPVPEGLIFLSTAAASEKSAIATGLFENYYTNDGHDFNLAVGPGLIEAGTQCCKTWGKAGALGENYLIAGKFGKTNGVGISKNGGRLYTGEGVPESVLPSEEYEARYADIASDDGQTIYVAHGSFPAPTPPADDDQPPVEYEAEHTKHLTERVSVHHNKKTGASRVQLNTPFHMDKASAPMDGYYAAITKSTDGGKTWKVQYQNTGNYYMNDISCHSADHCVAAAEGPAGAIVMNTKDGGATWTTRVQEPVGASCAAVQMLSETEVWAACGEEKSQFDIEAIYYHSTDGGGRPCTARV